MPEHQWQPVRRNRPVLRDSARREWRFHADKSNGRCRRKLERKPGACLSLVCHKVYVDLREIVDSSASIASTLAMHQSLMQGRTRIELGCIDEDFPKSPEDRLASKRVATESRQVVLKTDGECLVSL